jgi:hypothetical protein
MSAAAGMSHSKLRSRLSSPVVRAGLLALTVACIVGLTLLKATAVDAGPLAGVLRVILPFAFVGLTLVDFRASVAVAAFELVLGGASGSWTSYGAHLSGRIFLDGVVMLRAISIIIAAWRGGERSVLGRYGVHALALAFLFPAIWMPIGLLHHNGAGNVFGDGNGYAFFAFALVVITLVRLGYGVWFRNVFLAACATNGVVNLLLVVASVSHLINLASIKHGLHDRLSMGGVIGYMGNGAFRLFTASSLFLQIGLALTAWLLLERPRAYRYWLLYTVFWIDLVATYTRGLWVAGALTLALVIALGAPTMKRALTVTGVTAAGFAIAMLISPVAGFSLSDYVFKRTTSITSSYVTHFPQAVVNPSFERSRGWHLTDSGTRSVRVRRVTSVHKAGSRSLELTNTSANEDDYVYENLSVKPNTGYKVSAWVSSPTGSSFGEGKGLFVWEAQDGLTFNAPIGRVGSGWKRLAIDFRTGRRAHDLQLRLYAPLGRVYWDSVAFGVKARLAHETAAAAVPPQLVITSTGARTGNSDIAGEISNGYRLREAKSLFRHIRKHPLIGSGFGAVATDFAATGYRYELSYLDILFKAGIVGLLLFLSFPLRLIWDALRLRFGGEKTRVGTPRAGAIVVAIVSGVLLAAATNPYLFSAFGTFAILVTLAWLEPAPQPGKKQPPRR